MSWHPALDVLVLVGYRWFPSGSDRAELYALRYDGDRWIWDYRGPAPD